MVKLPIKTEVSQALGNLLYMINSRSALLSYLLVASGESCFLKLGKWKSRNQLRKKATSS